ATRRPEPRALEDVLKKIEEAETRLRQAGGGPAPRVQESLLGGAEVRRMPIAERPALAPGSMPQPTPRPTPGAARDAAARPPAAAAGAPRAVDAPAAPPSADIGTSWQRVIDEVMRRKPTLGAVLAQTRPTGLRDRELVIVLSGNSFHRDLLSDGANR